MPKETFFNLPEEKRQQILDVAIDEFANHDYGSVSISRLVARAGIAKGSFYQYFENKEDLYIHLLELLAEKKKAMFSLDHPDPEHVGIFRYLYWVVENALHFELRYPELVRLGYRAYAAPHTLPQAVQSWLQSQVRQESMAFYRRLVALGQEQGDIRQDLNPDLVASIFEIIFTSLNQTLIGYIAEHIGGEQEDQPLFIREEILALYHQALNILERGLAPAPPAPTSTDQPVSEEVMS
ncbi:MAG: TetR family transcriptional regulator [Litorilinea sp.]|nr:MAG: TetR family transcriptional regulator [Litorilinea sp.]